MVEIRHESLDNGPDAFNLYKEGKKIGEMIVEVRGSEMTVFHTEVDEEEEGKGYAAMILAEMVKYVREQNLKVIPMCVYVKAQFDRHPDLYQDIRSQNPAKF